MKIDPQIELLSKDDLLALLKKACDDAGTIKNWAMKHNLSPSFVSDVLKGDRKLGNAIPIVMGYYRIELYVKHETNNQVTD